MLSKTVKTLKFPSKIRRLQNLKFKYDYGSILSFSRFTTTNPNHLQNTLIDNEEKLRRHLKHLSRGTYPTPQSVYHPHLSSMPKNEDYLLKHKIWSDEEVNTIQQTHIKPKKLVDWCAYISVKLIRFGWDLTTGYLLGRKYNLFPFTYKNWLLRIVFLETVAGVPGMMFAMVRHLRSLRRMQRDNGWINTLLSEAENERMHLLVALKQYEPGLFVRGGVICAQTIMCLYLFIAYAINPIYCHRFVGYIEEEAVRTYSGLIKDINNGKYPQFEQQCSDIAKTYWNLPEESTWKDVFLQMRADEANHRDVNHGLAPIAKESNAPNPFRNEYTN